MGARKKEVETESHLLTIAEREEGRLKQEIKKLEKELEDLKEKKNVFEVRTRTNQGPAVVQSIVSLTTSLRSRLVKYMKTTLSNTLLFFVGKL